MILYEHDETEFETLGIGTIYDCIDDVVTEEINGIFELEFDYPITGELFKDIRFRRIVYCKPNPYAEPEPFRIYSISMPINGIISVNAHHISYDTSGYPIKENKFANLQQVVDTLNTNKVIIDYPFKFTTNITSENDMVLEAPTSIRNFMGNQIIEAYKPEYQYNKFNIAFLKQRGSDTSEIIQYGDNLIDYTQEETISNMYTSVYPYWTNHGNNDEKVLKTLPEKIVATPGTWSFTKVLILDISSNFKEEPTDVQMRDFTNKYITDNELGIPTVSLSVSFIHLSNNPILLGDTVTVDFILAKVKTIAKCIKTTYSPRLDRYIDIELGKPKGNLANTIVSGFSTTSKQISETKTYVDNVVGSSPGTTTSATALTSGVLSSTNRNFKMDIGTGDFSIGGLNGLSKHTDDYSEWRHGNSEVTRVGFNGMYRGNSPYLSLVNKGSIDITDTLTFRTTVTLPSSWSGREFEVMLNVEDTKNAAKNKLIDIKLRVVSKNLINATFIVEGFIISQNTTGTDISTPIKFSYIAIGG